MRSPSLLFLFSFSFLFSADYYADTTGTDNSFCSQSNPCEHIQTAINLTNNGDVVIVSGGTYLENLLIETGITLKSADQNNPAIIDGSSPATDPALWNGGSCIVIRTPRGASSRVTATVEDVHLTGGKGTEIIEDSNKDGDFDDPEDEIKIVGGGMIIHKAGLLSRGNKIMNNGDSSTKEGGAVYAAGTGADIPDPQPADPPDDPLPNERLVITFEETIFAGNDAQIGHSVMVNGWNPENQFIDMDFGNSQFDCVFDSVDNAYDGVSEYWIKGKDNTSFDFTGGISSEIPAIINDVWVDPNNGVNEGNFIGEINYPFLTINYALSMIYPTEDNPIMIHLIAGTFSPSTNNESFPIIITSNISLTGVGEEITILDAESNEENPVRVITIEQSINNSISDMTITGGNTTYPHYYGGGGQGGGIKVSFPFGGPPPVSIDSHPTLSNLTIRGNSSSHGGGGISMSAGYSGTLTNITVSGNYALAGGGVQIYNASPNMHQIIITQNTASSTGGLSIVNSSSIITDMLISENIAETIVGGVRIGNTGDNYNTTLTNVDIIGNMSNPTGGQNSSAGGIEISGTAELTNVLISGNSAYSAGGLYIRGFDFSVLSVILNNVTISENIAEGWGGGVYMWDADQSVQFSNVTISSNECGYDGGGMYLYNSNPWLTNMTISNNIGEGMYLFNSSPYLENIIIKDNEAHQGAGVYISDDNPPVTGRRLLITDNIAESSGGGIYLSPNAEISLEHSTISNNIFTYSSGNGAGIYTDGGNVNLVNSIVYHNKRVMNDDHFIGDCSDWDESGCIGTAYNFCQWVLNPETNMEECDDLIDPNIYGYSENLLAEYNISYSNIEGYSVLEGEGNISQNPEFTDLENGIYSLSGGSPCIDAGTADIDGDGVEDIADYFGSAPDMGAYEFEGSSAAGDLNSDGLINILDVVMLVNIVLGYGEPVDAGDLNGDGLLNILDVVALVSIILEG